MLSAFIFFFSLTHCLNGQQPDQRLQEAKEQYEQQQYDKALEITSVLLEQTASGDNRAILIRAQLLNADIYNRKKDYAERLAAANEALQIASSFPDQEDSLYAQSLRAKGDAFIRLAQYDSSIFYLKRAEMAFAELTNWEEAAACQVGQGANYYRLKDYAHADTLLSSARNLMEERLEQLPSLYGTVMNLLGAVYRALGDHEKALQNSLNAVRFNEQYANDPQRLTYAYNNLGTAYFQRADYNKAEEILLLAETNAMKGSEQDHASLSNIYNNLMLVNSRKKSYDRAWFYGNKRLELIASDKTKPSVASQIRFYNNLALVCIETDSLTKARSLLDQALELDDSDPQTQANLGYYFYRLHDWKSAGQWLSKGIASYGDQNDADVSKLYRYRAVVGSVNGDQQQALSDFNRAIALLVPGYRTEENAYALPSLQNVRSKRELLRALIARAKHLKQQDPTSEAVQQNLLHAVALADSMYYQHQAEGSRTFLKTELMPLYEMTIADLSQTLSQSDNPDLYQKLFSVFEKSRSNQLADLLQLKQSNQLAGVPTDLIEQETSLQVDIAFYETQEYLADLKKDSLKQQLYKNYRLNKINERDRLIERFKEEFPRYYQARHQPLSPSLKAARQRLQNKDELMIEYFVGEQNIYALGLTKQEVAIVNLGPTDTLRKASLGYLKNLNEPDRVIENAQQAYSELGRSGFYLFQRLVKPVLDQLENPTKGLYVIPDEFLNYLPFESLLTNATEGASIDINNLPYLIKTYQVRYGYAATLPMSAHNHLGSRILAMAPFGNTALKHTSTEVLSIKNHLTDGQFYESSGSEQDFKGLADDFGILHLATHGTLAQDNPQLSYLSFQGPPLENEDQRLHVFELENMQLNAQLAVLSACETGMGRLVSGEGVMSLARAFSYAGVPSVVMSLWQVDDLSAGELMNHFYEQLSQSRDKATALRTAKLNYLQQADPLHAHPYFWSQFVLIGDPAPLQTGGFQIQSKQVVLISIAMVVLLLILFYLVLRPKKKPPG